MKAKGQSAYLLGLCQFGLLLVTKIILYQIGGQLSIVQLIYVMGYSKRYLTALAISYWFGINNIQS